MTEIQTPRGAIVTVQTGSGKTTAKLVWNPNFSSKYTAKFDRVQKYIDSECLRHCDKLVPMKTGMLKKSGILGTVIGSGRIRYIVPYAGPQYYKGRANGQRGRLWFERMKRINGNDILRGAAQKLKG